MRMSSSRRYFKRFYHRHRIHTRDIIQICQIIRHFLHFNCISFRKMYFFSVCVKINVQAHRWNVLLWLVKFMSITNELHCVISFPSFFKKKRRIKALKRKNLKDIFSIIANNREEKKVKKERVKRRIKQKIKEEQRVRNWLGIVNLFVLSLS